MLLRCTSKVLKQLKISSSQLSDPLESAGALEEWYVNLFYWDRCKCLMFANAASLFAFVVVGASRKEIRDLAGLFRKELSKALFYEEFDSGQIQQMMKLADKIAVAKTCDRSVLASMNQMTWECEFLLEDEDVVAANRELNQGLRGAIAKEGNNYGVPLQRFKELLGDFLQN